MAEAVYILVIQATVWTHTEDEAKWEVYVRTTLTEESKQELAVQTVEGRALKKKSEFNNSMLQRLPFH
jgi:hypothetical protein